MNTGLKFRAITASFTSSRYSELEKRIEKETDPVKRSRLERELRYAMRMGRTSG